MSVSNTVPVTSLGGAAPAPGPFPFRPASANLGTPIITGTITGGVVVADVLGDVFGGVYNYIHIEATDPQAGAILQIPITLPVTPLPDRFEVDLFMFTGAPPTADFQAGLAFMDSTGDRAWELFHSVTVASTSRPVIRILEIDSGVIGATWDLPSVMISNAVEVHAAVEKVAPFAALPQVRMEVTGGTFTVGNSKVSANAYASNKTSGTISPGWVGEDFVSAQIVAVFTSTMVGAVDLFVAVDFLPHVKDR